MCIAEFRRPYKRVQRHVAEEVVSTDCVLRLVKLNKRTLIEFQQIPDTERMVSDGDQGDRYTCDLQRAYYQAQR